MRIAADTLDLLFIFCTSLPLKKGKLYVAIDSSFAVVDPSIRMFEAYFSPIDDSMAKFSNSIDMIFLHTFEVFYVSFYFF
jgi:hypothetical protein